MAELHEEDVWHVPYTAEQIQASIGKNPVYSEVDENGDRYWMLWDISTSQYVKTDVKVFIGDIDQISAEADRAETAADSAAESASSADEAAGIAQEAIEKLQGVEDLLKVAVASNSFKNIFTKRLV